MLKVMDIIFSAIPLMFGFAAFLLRSGVRICHKGFKNSTVKLVKLIFMGKGGRI